MKIKFRNKISVKLLVSIFLILSLVLAVNTYITTSQLEKDLTEFRLMSAYNSSDIIKKSTRYSMLLNRREDVHQIINTIGKENGLIGIRVYNKQGYIVFSTDSTEISKQVTMTDKACAGCHTLSGHTDTLKMPYNLRYFKTEKGERALGLINPIQNEKDCSAAACHAHEPNVKILGVLDVIISLKKLDDSIAKTNRSNIFNSILIIIAISIFCGVFITLFVSKPLKKITHGIDQVGGGNLNYKIELDSRNELGEVAKRFNDMASRLDLAYTEIKDFSDTLTKKVNEKTEELKNIYDQVIQIEKLASLGKLSATVAHELNNPLSGILTYSKLISKKLKESPSAAEHVKLIEYLQLISDESARCGKIVKDLLLFSHRGDEDFSPENLKRIIDKAVLLIKHHLEIHLVALHKEYPEEDCLVYCDPQKIQQAVMSLLINAIEAMPNGGKINIKIACEGEFAVIRVSDSGTGIREEDLQHIFEPFFTTKETGKGTGLGLAVVYGIIKRHKGNIEVEKTSPEGTTFKISIPIVKK
jgi:two-component system NtrC family sensor kinase